MIARILYAGGRKVRQAVILYGTPRDIRTPDRLVRSLNLSVETYNNSVTYDTCHFVSARHKSLFLCTEKTSTALLSAGHLSHPYPLNPGV